MQLEGIHSGSCAPAESEGQGVALFGAPRMQRDLPSLATVFSQTLRGRCVIDHASANAYALAALDHSSGSSFFKLIMSNSDYPGYGGFYRNPQHVATVLPLFDKPDR